MFLKPTKIALSTNAAQCTDPVTGVQESTDDLCNTNTYLLPLATPERNSSWQLPGSMRNRAKPLKSCRAQVDLCRCQAAAAEIDRKSPRPRLCPHRIHIMHYWWCCLFRSSWTSAKHRLLPGQCQAAAARSNCKPAETSYCHYRNHINTTGAAACAKQWGFMPITGPLCW